MNTSSPQELKYNQLSPILEPEMFESILKVVKGLET